MRTYKKGTVYKARENILIPEGEDINKISEEIREFDNKRERDHAQKDILSEARRIVDGDRRDDYGTLKKSYKGIAEGWSSILETPVSEKEVALMMVWMKVCREKHRHKRDNLVDIAGYAYCLSQLEDDDVKDDSPETVFGKMSDRRSEVICPGDGSTGECSSG